MHCNREKPLLAETRECPRAAMKTQCNQKIQITQMWSPLSASSCHAHPTLPRRDHFHLVAPPQTFLCNPVMQEFSMYSFLLKHPVEGTVSLLICKLYYFFLCKINVSLRKNLCLGCDLHNAECIRIYKHLYFYWLVSNWNKNLNLIFFQFSCWFYMIYLPLKKIIFLAAVRVFSP